jgi:hypothetical protein
LGDTLIISSSDKSKLIEMKKCDVIISDKTHHEKVFSNEIKVENNVALNIHVNKDVYKTFLGWLRDHTNVKQDQDMHKHEMMHLI